MADDARRVGAIDVGSNAIRFTAAAFASGRRTDLDYQRVPVRLGHQAFRTGRLTSDRIDAAVDALSSFRQRMDALHLHACRAVATSAVRDSRNGGELVERVGRETGIDLEPIDGGEEARLVWVAARDRLPLDGRWLIADLGGGSLEVSVAGEGGVTRTESHPLGTIRLLDLEGRDEPDAVGAALATLRLPGAGVDRVRGMIATGGNIEALAELAGAHPDPDGVARLPLALLERTHRDLAQVPADQRGERFGLAPDRADVIVPAAAVYSRVAELAGAEEIVVPGVGVKDGILIELARSSAERGPDDTR